jgi:hypothetical protein
MVRRSAFLGLGAFALLGACAKVSDAEALSKSCTERGERPEICSCLVNAMQTKLPPELFARTADTVGRQNREVEDFIRDLPKDDQIHFAVIVGDMDACATENAPPN